MGMTARVRSILGADNTLAIFTQPNDGEWSGRQKRIYDGLKGCLGVWDWFRGLSYRAFGEESFPGK